VLWGGRLKPSEAVKIPDAPYVHLFVAKGDGTLEGAGPLEIGDAVRMAKAGTPEFWANASTGAEILIWEMAT